MQTTVSVFGGPGVGNRVMYIDSYHQANDNPNMVFIHARIGLLPALLHPQPKRALVVGLGGGATAGALSQYPGIQVDVVELSGGVVRGAEQFAHVNFDVLHRPNVSIRVDDGRNYLLRARGQYDVITADAIIPTNAGANNLYSAEYFELVHDALAPGGIALHWNGAGNATEYALILRAFVKAFPNTTLWGDGKLMVGWKDPPALSRGRIDAMLADPRMRGRAEADARGAVRPPGADVPGQPRAGARPCRRGALPHGRSAADRVLRAAAAASARRISPGSRGTLATILRP